MKTFPKVFVIILNYNGMDVLKRCLLSVFKSEYPNLEIVLVDNNSTDGSLEMAKSTFSKPIFIRNEENLGFAAGNNVGIRFALERMADFVVLLNNDTEVEKDFLEKLVAMALRQPEAGILSPVIFDGNTRQIWFAGGQLNWWTMKAKHETAARTEEFYETDFITGCAMLVRKEVFREIGLLDEDYFLYWEDADFSWRARKAGFKLGVVSDSWVYHFEKSERKREQKLYWLVISGLIFFKKNASFFKKMWLKVYLQLRKIKNQWDIVLNKENREAVAVQRAYKDFKNAKF